MRWGLAVACLSVGLSGLASAGQAELDPTDGRALQLGDAPPRLTVLSVDGDATPPPIASGVRVVEFWATWCPMSRRVLAHQDTTLAMDVDIIAITEEAPDHVRGFLDRASWTHLDVRCDAAGATRRAYLDTLGQEITLPFAFVVGPARPGGDPVILWMGTTNPRDVERPGESLEQVVQSIRAGEYDLAAAEDAARQDAELHVAIVSLTEAGRERDLDRLASLVGEAADLRGRTATDRLLVDRLNGVAWDLVTRDATEPGVTAALGAIELALARGGDDDAAVVDTYARVLFESDRVADAVTAQERAVALGAGRADEGELQAVLDRYRDALAGSSGETPPGSPDDDEDPTPWTGSLNAIHDAFSPDDFILVRPDAVTDTSFDARWDTDLASLKEGLYTESIIKRAQDVTKDDRRSRVLVLYGTPDTNPLTQQVLETHGITLVEDGVRVGEEYVAAAGPVVITALPSPWATGLPVVIYTAYREADAFNGNAFFHGPTGLVVGRWADERPRVALAADLVLRDDGSERVQGLLVGKAKLSVEAALADLESLHELLHLHYAGYDDIGWELEREGSSWSDRTDAFRDRVVEGAPWAWADFFDLVLEYLSPVQDFHFVMEGTGAAPAPVGCTSREARLVRSLDPYYTDLRLVARGGGYRVASAPGAMSRFVGWEVVKVPMVDDPRRVDPGTPYLFPTLPRPVDPDDDDASAFAPEFLLGTLADPGNPPTTLTVDLRRPPDRPPMGVTRSMAIDLHPSRVTLPRRGRDAWSVQHPPETPLPVLEVRTMSPRRLGDLPQSADTLRHQPRLVLDLRANGGGSDTPALLWTSQFSGQDYRWECGAQLFTGEMDPWRRWSSWLDGPVSNMNLPVAPGDREPYPGQLVVLIDKGVASSGETFTMLAAQVTGAVVVGENTAGCATYGNVVYHDPLPHSRISLSFGRTKFVLDCVKPMREGVGFFPDYWLDTDDPVAVIAEYLERAEAVGGVGF